MRGALAPRQGPGNPAARGAPALQRHERVAAAVHEKRGHRVRRVAQALHHGRVARQEGSHLPPPRAEQRVSRVGRARLGLPPLRLRRHGWRAPGVASLRRTAALRAGHPLLMRCWQAHIWAPAAPSLCVAGMRAPRPTQLGQQPPQAARGRPAQVRQPARGQSGATARRRRGRADGRARTRMQNAGCSSGWLPASSASSSAAAVAPCEKPAPRALLLASSPYPDPNPSPPAPLHGDAASAAASDAARLCAARGRAGAGRGSAWRAHPGCRPPACAPAGCPAGGCARRPSRGTAPTARGALRCPARRTQGGRALGVYPMPPAVCHA